MKRELLTDSDVVRINGRFVHAFYCEPSDIRTLVEKRNPSPIEIYDKANQELEVRYES